MSSSLGSRQSPRWTRAPSSLWCRNVRSIQSRRRRDPIPEHLAEGLQPWQPKKLYITRSRWRRGNTETADTPVLKIDTGEYNALLGLSYAQIARQGLSYQRSQGVGQTRASKGSSVTELQLIDTTLPDQQEPEDSLFDGLDTTIMGMQNSPIYLHSTQNLRSFRKALTLQDKTMMPVTRGQSSLTRHRPKNDSQFNREDTEYRP